MGRRRAAHDWPGRQPLAEVDGREFLLPIRYHDNAQFSAVFPADYDAVSTKLPSGVLHPVRWTRGRTLVTVAAMRYRQVSVQSPLDETQLITPYAEILVGALVEVGRPRRANPLGVQSTFVLHLPVTTREAYDAGKQLWSYPTSVADMDFCETRDERAVIFSEGGDEILTLEVRPSGVVLPDTAPVVTYTSKDGHLLRTTLHGSGHVQLRPGNRGGDLFLGSHPVAEGLRQLDVAPEPVVTWTHLDSRRILPAGVPVAAAMPYQAFDRADRERARYTVAYSSTQPIDQYADPSRTSCASDPFEVLTLG